jgi:hypothetical protein
MALIYKSTEKHVAKIGKKEIEFTPWTTKTEKEYLSLIEKQESITDKDIFDILIGNNIIDNTIVLSTEEQKLLLIEIRKVSISETFEDTIKCKSCKHEEKLTIKIDDIVKYKESSWEPVQVQNIQFNLGDIRTLKEKNRLKPDNGIVNYIFTDFILHVHSIKIDEELHENLKFNEIQEFMDSLPTKIFDVVFDKYREMVDSLILEYKCSCSKCSAENTVEYENIPGLLWI